MLQQKQHWQSLLEGWTKSWKILAILVEYRQGRAPKDVSAMNGSAMKLSMEKAVLYSVNGMTISPDKT